MIRANKSIVITEIFLLISSFLQAQVKPNSEKERIKQQQLNQLLNLARTYEQRAQFSKALEIYKQLWDDDPANINYYRGVKDNLMNLGNFEAAEVCINKMLQVNATALIQVDLADLYFNKGEKEKAFEIWQQILKTDDQNLTSYQIVASSMMRNFLYDEALAVYQEGQKKLNNASFFLIDMANIYRLRQDYKNAVLNYLNYLKYYPSQYTFVEQSIMSFASEPESASEIEEILLSQSNTKNSCIELRNILAAFYIRTSNYRAALNEYATIDNYILTRSKNEKSKLGQELFRFAQNAFNDAEYEYAIQAYQLVLTRYPESPLAINSKYGTAIAYEKLNHVDKAIEFYTNIINEHHKTLFAKKSQFRIGEIQLNNFSDPILAEKSFKKVLEMLPVDSENIEAIFRIGDCYVQMNALTEAAIWYKRVLEHKLRDDYFTMKAEFMLAQIFYWQGSFDKAEETFQQIVVEPINLITDQQGAYANDALEYIMLIDENRNLENSLKQFAIADLLIVQKKFESAIDIYRELTQQQGGIELLDDAWLKLGQLLSVLKNYAESIKAFQSLIDLFPTSIFADLAQKSIGDIYDVGLNDSAKALKAYELILTKYPNSIYLEEVRNKIRGIERRVL